MRTNKTIKLDVNKPYDYKPIPRSEIIRVRKLVTAEILEVANRFDGPSRIEIIITAVGNA